MPDGTAVKSEIGSLEEMRERLCRILLGLAWIHVLIAVVTAWSLGSDPITFGAIAGAFAVLATVAPRLGGAMVGRAILMVALQSQVATFVAILAGHPWQVDVHMYFFAIMGAGVMLVDIGALLAAAAAVAVHHLAFNFLAAGLVYPGGSDLGRTVLHAVILIAETAALIVATHLIQRLFSEANAAAALSRQELAKAQKATEHAAAVEKEAEKRRDAMMSTLETAFGDVVEAAVNGEFDRRAPTDFEAAQLNRLAHSINRLVEQIDRSLGDAVDVMERIAAGDLNAAMAGDYRGRFRSLQDCIGATGGQLSGIIRSIRKLSTDIAASTRALGEQGTDLATRTERQSALLTEVSSAMNELSGQINSNAGMADKGMTIASDATQFAERSGQVVSETIDAMRRIEEGSGRISDIVGVIDDIAFQTNLLALNAAVEAARAGEAGKGFSVVAAEVRALAKRASDSASDIKTLISESSDQVANGVELVNQTGEELNKIVAAIQRVAETSSEISKITQHQTLSVDRMLEHIDAMDRSTRQNASIAAKSAETGDQLSGQGAEFARLVEVFKVEDAETRSNAA